MPVQEPMEDLNSFLEQLSAEGKKLIEDQGFTSLEDLKCLGGDLLRDMGLKFPDVAKVLRLEKAKRARDTDDDEDGKTKNQQRLVEAGILEDQMDLASIQPTHWAHGSLKSTIMLWRQLFPGNVHVWEELSFLALLVDQVHKTATQDLQILVWSRLLCLAAKLKCPAQAAMASGLVKDKLMSAQRIGNAGCQMKVMLELMASLKTTTPMQRPGQGAHNHSSNSTNNNSNSNTNGNANSNNNNNFNRFHNHKGFRGTKGNS